LLPPWLSSKRPLRGARSNSSLRYAGGNRHAQKPAVSQFVGLAALSQLRLRSAPLGGGKLAASLPLSRRLASSARPWHASGSRSPTCTAFECCLTPRSSRFATACAVSPDTGTVYIFCVRAYSAHLRSRLSSNVGQHKRASFAAPERKCGASAPRASTATTRLRPRPAIKRTVAA
jgi:hypothetical protein